MELDEESDADSIEKEDEHTDLVPSESESAFVSGAYKQ